MTERLTLRQAAEIVVTANWPADIPEHIRLRIRDLRAALEAEDPSPSSADSAARVYVLDWSGLWHISRCLDAPMWGQTSFSGKRILCGKCVTVRQIGYYENQPHNMCPNCVRALEGRGDV